MITREVRTICWDLREHATKICQNFEMITLTKRKKIISQSCHIWKTDFDKDDDDGDKK